MGRARSPGTWSGNFRGALRPVIAAPIVACVFLAGCYSVGGTVSGLTGTGLVLQDNGADNLNVSSNGPFTFASQPIFQSYTVTVARQPFLESCWVANGSGVWIGGSVTNVTVNCGNTSKVLVVGGSAPPSFCDVSLGTGEIYDSSFNSFSVDLRQMPDPREDFAQAATADGRVLLVGGINSSRIANSGSCNVSVLNSATIFGLGSGFSPTAPMNVPRFGAGAALLPSGDILVAGGNDLPLAPGSSLTSDNTGSLNSAEIYHPATNSFTLLSSVMGNPRTHPTVTSLLNGQVLIFGGSGQGLPALATAEIFNPSSQNFTLISTANARSYHTATLLKDGTVLLTGGVDATGQLQATAEVYNPSSQTSSFISPMTIARAAHTATLLNDGRVLIVGGIAANGVPLNSAEVYDPQSGSFSVVSQMLSPRAWHTATLLYDGRVLVVGGYGGYLQDGSLPNFWQTSELFDGQSFSSGPSMTVGRRLHGAQIVLFEEIGFQSPVLRPPRP